MTLKTRKRIIVIKQKITLCVFVQQVFISKEHGRHMAQVFSDRCGTLRPRGGTIALKKYRLLLGSVSTVQTDLKLKEKRVRIAQKLPLNTHLRKHDANFPGRAVNIPRAGTPPQDPPPESHYWVKEEAFFRPAPKPLIGQRPQQSGKQHGKRLEEKKL